MQRGRPPAGMTISGSGQLPVLGMVGVGNRARISLNENHLHDSLGFVSGEPMEVLAVSLDEFEITLRPGSEIDSLSNYIEELKSRPGNEIKVAHLSSTAFRLTIAGDGRVSLGPIISDHLGIIENSSVSVHVLFDVGSVRIFGPKGWSAWLSKASKDMNAFIDRLDGQPDEPEPIRFASENDAARH